ncbi:S-layer homology domain-containing protein [Paenibacillus thalictri]|uniref:S-layer homology domain-containing protein n=2 Tax=Paenibacillus thalictri TaxID=2527873 RepID=A0A4Q9DWD9_9BACL|nr:S-layer homology domain-containing protein [Paenibacillus thalictri]
MAGNPLTLTATGDRQSATGAVYGDERYVPLSWKSSEGSEKAGPFILSGGSYFSTYTPSVEGTYTVSALFSRQSWDGNNWNDTSDQSNATTTVTVIAASGQPTLADASKNVVSANPSSVFVGDTVTLTAAGDRQTVTGIVYGDERYVPVGWTSTESGKMGTFSKSGNDYTSDYTPSSIGSYTVTVDYKKETWNVTEWVYGNYVDKKTITVNATPVTAVFADASKNSITANPSSVIIGGTTTLTAAGDRQTVAGRVYGDERYVPASWTSTESGKTGVFSQNGNDYTSSYTPSSLGSYTVTVSFKKEMWNVTEWVYSNDIDEKTITITARILQSSSGGNGGNSGNTGSASSSDSSSESSVIVQVNGKSENAGTATSSKRDGQSVLTIVVDPKKLSAKLAEEGQHALVTIPVDSQSDVVIGELTGQMIKEMENQQAVFEIKTPLAAYTVPALQINMDAIAGQFGGSPSLQDIHVQIEIAAPTAAVMKAITDAANKGSFSVAVPPVTFTIKATYENKTIEVSSFNAYVERTIAIPDGIDPGKITTGVVMDADGTVRHVPTRVVVQDGKYYAKLNSLTNSTYALVWNPQEYSDVAAHWAKQPVNDIGSRMVVSGTGDNLFNPDRDITRGEFAAIIVRGLALKVENGTTSFSDVKAADWYSGAIRTAAAYRLISGFEDGTFRPNESTTREQAMMIIARAMEITGLRDTLSASSTDAKLRSYTDAANISPWAQSSVADSLAAGIMTGRTSAELAPKANMTRAEVAVIIQRLLRISGLI